MTPEQEAMLKEVYAWMKERQVQAIPYPMDDASKAALEVVVDKGVGASGLTDSITIPAGGGSANVPKAYAGTIIIESKGVKHEVPYIA